MALQEIVQNLLTDDITQIEQAPDSILTVVVTPNALARICEKLKTDNQTQFDMLTDITAVDWLRYPNYKKHTSRFSVVLHLLSTTYLHRIRIKTAVDNQMLTVPTLTHLWKNADWLEREVWDMYGIIFTGHPNLKRILMYTNFQGHPLRKDYPITKRQPLIGPKN